MNNITRAKGKKAEVLPPTTKQPPQNKRFHARGLPTDRGQVVCQLADGVEHQLGRVADGGGGRVGTVRQLLLLLLVLMVLMVLRVLVLQVVGAGTASIA